MDSFRGVNPSPGNLQVVYKCPSALSTPIGYNRLPMNRIILTAAAWSLLFPSGLLRAQTPPRAFALQAESPRFWDLFDRGAALEKVAGGFGFLEGPVWEHRGRFLYVSDETLNKISRVYPDGRTETVLENRRSRRQHTRPESSPDHHRQRPSRHRRGPAGRQIPRFSR